MIFAWHCSDVELLNQKMREKNCSVEANPQNRACSYTRKGCRRTFYWKIPSLELTPSETTSVPAMKSTFGFWTKVSADLRTLPMKSMLEFTKTANLVFFAYPNLHESSRMRKFTKSTTDRSAQSILVPRLGLGQLFLTKSIKVHDSNEVFRYTNQFKMVERWFLSETDTSELRQTSRFQIQCYLVDFSGISSYLFHLS